METLLSIALIMIGFILVLILFVLAYNTYLDRKLKNRKEDYKYYLIRVNKVGEIQMKKYNPGGGINYPKF